VKSRISILSLMLLAAGCAGSGGAPPEAAALPPAVEAVQARSGTLPLTERLSGVARAANQVELRPEIAGVVARVLVRSGDTVRRGEPLVVLREETQREQAAQAEAALDLAEASAREEEARRAELEAQVVRTRALAAQDLVSDLELETREAQLAAAVAAAAQERARVAQARAALQESRAARERTVVRAPVDGRVGRRLVEPGARVDSSTLLFVLGSLDRLVVEVPLTESMLSYVEEGQPVRLTSRALPGAALAATVSRIPPFLSEGSFSTVAEIDVDNDGGSLRPGMFVTVDVLYGESRTATLVPAGALVEDPATGGRRVFVVLPGGDEARALESATELSESPLPVEARTVEVIAEGRGSVGVRGVEDGEWVVTVGQHLLVRDGAGAARVRPTTWERVSALQSLQREDLLRQFLEKQRRIAGERGATPVPSRDYVIPAPAPAPGPRS
jgi:RND family efflux transporter MFP subunit